MWDVPGELADTRTRSPEIPDDHIQFVDVDLTVSAFDEAAFQGDADEERVQLGLASTFDTAIGEWVAENGVVFRSEHIQHESFAIGLGHHVALSRLKWDVLILLPLFLLNSALGRAPSPTDAHGFLTSLAHALVRLNDNERAVLYRLRDQRAAFGQSNLELLTVGLSASDQRVVADVVSKLTAAGVLVRRSDGRFEVVF